MATHKRASAEMMSVIAGGVGDPGARTKLVKDAFYELDMALSLHMFDLEKAKSLVKSRSTIKSEKIYEALHRGGLLGKAGSVIAEMEET